MSCPEVPEKPTVSSHYEKGSIHWLDYESDARISSQKARPYMIISRNNIKSSRVIISPVVNLSGYVENGKLKYPYHAPLLKNIYSFLEKDSVVLLDQMYTIPKEELWEEWFMGQINDFTDLDTAVCYNFDLFKSITDSYVELISQYEQIYKAKFSRK